MTHFSTPKTLEETEQAISEYINYYNHKQIQLKYGMSPIKFRRHAA